MHENNELERASFRAAVPPLCVHPAAGPRSMSLATAVLAVLAFLLSLLHAVPGETRPGEQIEAFIERTGEIIERAAELVHETENQQARRILREARAMHERSLAFLERRQLQQAVAVSRRAREAAQHAARLARETHNHQERLRLRLERFHERHEQLLERARDAGDERVLRFLREAGQQALRALNHYRQGNHDLALHLLDVADELLGRVSRLLLEGLDRERLEREIERTRSLLERTADQLREASGPQRETGLDLLRSASDALRRAEEFRERQQPVRALHSLRLARQIAAQAAAAADETADSGAVEAQLARWDARHAQLSEEIGESGSQPALALLERALHHREQAGRRLAAGEIEPALRQLRAAFDLLNEASVQAR